MPLSTIQRTTLANGLRVVVEPVPDVRSVSVGVWVDTGSRDEYDGVRGVSHFLEHLLFKGTQRWSAVEIAWAMDAVGGEFNAFTSKEHTVFYVRTLDADVPLGLDILADITQRPAFRSADIESERSVVLEEINMYEDSPDDLVHDLFIGALLADHPLGPPVLGTRESIEAMTRDGIAGYHALRYKPSTFVVAAAGNLDPDTFVAAVEAAWGGMAGTAPQRPLRQPVRAERVRADERPTEQAHIMLGTETIDRASDRRHALTLLNHIFGGGMSSRLFQEVREKRGLVYSVYSYRSLFQETGFLAAYAGTAPERADNTLAVLSAEWDRLGAGVSADELTAAKSHVRGALALSQEDTASRMSRIGKAELIYGRVPTIDETVAEIEAVTLDEVNALAGELAASPRTLAVIGPCAESSLPIRGAAAHAPQADAV
jgi:predicted Zn-dependent peptidase